MLGHCCTPYNRIASGSTACWGTNLCADAAVTPYRYRIASESTASWGRKSMLAAAVQYVCMYPYSFHRRRVSREQDLIRRQYRVHTSASRAFIAQNLISLGWFLCMSCTPPPLCCEYISYDSLTYFSLMTSGTNLSLSGLTTTPYVVLLLYCTSNGVVTEKESAQRPKSNFPGTF